jgi:uncharacterized membrane protein YhaH (DUF805 family)
MLQAYRRYADFEGRAGRAEYWLFVALYVLAALVCDVVGRLLDAIGGDNLALVIYLPYGVFLLVSFVPGLAVAFRRLHDIDRSAWWLLIVLVPVLGTLVLIVLNCLPGRPEPNRFGPQPGATRPDLQETFA